MADTTQGYGNNTFATTNNSIDIRDDYSYKSLVVCGDGAKNIVEIHHNGDVYWMGRKVETDDEFKSAVLDLLSFMATGKRYERFDPEEKL